MFVPVKDYILIEPAYKPKSLVMPSSTEPVSDEVFRVTAVGPGDEDNKQFLKVGDLVCLQGYITKYKYDDEVAIVGRARDVMCIIKEEERGQN